jgi:putative peptidoglycan lipid II flippase
VTAPRRSILRTVLLLLPMQVVLALLPFLLAQWFGRTESTDIFNIAWVIFSLAGALVFSAYQDSAIVPILLEVKASRRDELPRVIGSLLAHTLTFGALLAFVIAAAAALFFRARYSGGDLVVATRMVVPFGVYLVALSVKTFLSAILNAEHRYFAQPLAASLGVFANVGLIALTRESLGVPSIAVGALAGEVVSVAVLAFVARVLMRMRVELTFERPEPVLRFARLVASEVGGAAITRVNPVIDQMMASLAGVVGGATLLRFSGDIASVPTSLLQAALLPVLLSHLAEDFTAGDMVKLRAKVSRSLVSVCAILVAAAALLYALREPILRFVFLRGKMDLAGVERMAHILPYHLVGLAPFGALLVLARAHVAIKNSGIMLGMGILNASLNAVFNVVLLKAIGLEGIALSTSCVQTAIAIVFWFRLEAKLAPRQEEAA